MANVAYTTGLLRLIQQGWATQDVRGLLIEDGYVPDPDHASLDDLSLETTELVATNYERLVVSALAESADDALDAVLLDGGDLLWASLGEPDGPTVSGLVLYFHVDGTDANDVPLFFLDNAGAEDPGYRLPRQTNGGDFAITWNTVGIATLTLGEPT